MAKAVTALTLGKNYTQDQALRWGFLTRAGGEPTSAGTTASRVGERTRYVPAGAILTA